jgi:hypothetical protein
VALASRSRVDDGLHGSYPRLGHNFLFADKPPGTPKASLYRAIGRSIPQAGVLTWADSVWVGARLAARQMESATTHGAPERAMLMALPAQLKWSCGAARSLGNQTTTFAAARAAVTPHKFQ